MNIGKPNKRYSVIYADPPWSYHQKITNVDRPITSKYQPVTKVYPTMPTGEICSLPIAGIADTDCLLFIWATSPCLEDAMQVGRAWGFEYKTIAFVWDKQVTVLGYYTMPQCEVCLVFKKGKIPQPRGIRNALQFISEKRTKHSKKPTEIRDRITKMFPEHNKIELFARERVDGWDCWGNEV